MNTDDLDELDTEPWESLRVEVQIESAPLRVVEPNDAIRHARARLVRYSDEGEAIGEVATLDFMQLEYGYGMDYGVSSFEIADAESQLLHDLHGVIFDGANLRAPFDDMAGLGHDVLVLERVTVASPEHFQSHASELIEHVLRRWAQGCLTGVYVEDRPMDPKLVGVLIDRGFRWHKTPELGMYVADLSGMRPALPGEPERRQGSVPRERSH